MNYLSIKDAAAALGVSQTQVRGLIDAGELAVTNVGRGTIRAVPRISEDELRSFLDKRTRRAGTGAA